MTAIITLARCLAVVLSVVTTAEAGLKLGVQGHCDGTSGQTPYLLCADIVVSLFLPPSLPLLGLTPPSSVFLPVSLESCIHGAGTDPVTSARASAPS